MPLRLISNPRRAVLIGLITVGALVTAVSQQPPDAERATLTTQRVSQEATKPVSVYIAKNNVPPIAELVRQWHEARLGWTR